MKKPILVLGLSIAVSLTYNITQAPASNPAWSISVHKATTTSQLLSKLKVKSESESNSYDRTLFQHWTDSDGDGCDTRDEVLQEESLTETDCSLVGGSWTSAYDGVKTTDSSTFDVDHFVPLKEAWESGASTWDSETRKNFANDLDYSNSLIAVSASSNRSKGDRDPASWLPKSTTFTCQYVARWIAVKYRWSLTIDAAEKKVLASKASSCGTKAKASMPTKAQIKKSNSITPTPTPTTPSGGTPNLDPQFASCAEAHRNGFNRAYRKGIDPEYYWYQDRDGDGVVCE